MQIYNALSRVKRKFAHIADKRQSRSKYSRLYSVHLAWMRSKEELGNTFSVVFQERYSWQFIFKQEHLGNPKGTLRER